MCVSVHLLGFHRNSRHNISYIIVKSFSIVLVSLCSVTLCVTSLQVQNILKYLFPVPKEDSKRVVTFANQEDYISFR